VIFSASAALPGRGRLGAARDALRLGGDADPPLALARVAAGREPVEIAHAGAPASLRRSDRLTYAPHGFDRPHLADI
jgi:hypothetical protein